MARKKTVTNVVAVPAVATIRGGTSVPTMKSVPKPPGAKSATSKTRTGGARSEFLRSVVARLSSHLHKSEIGWWHDTINPLYNISTRHAQMIYDFARSGNFAQLQYLYNEIENCSPVFSVCTTRRTGALSELGWKVVRSDERLNRGADEALIKEQIECVETAIAKIDNLPEAFEHFALSAFRGFSVASVWKGSDGFPEHLECLDHWNVCLDRMRNKWLWNPGAVSFMNPMVGSTGMQEIPESESIVIRRKREIDWPAMRIFLRETVGERDWGRFLETYGLPPVIITMPEFTNTEDQEAYVTAAAAVFEGRSGVIPFGSEVNFASESRGTNPFTEFVDHQIKLFVLLSTGGTLTSLSEATGIGSGASETQMDTWKQIVRADVRIISNAIDRQLCQDIIKTHFPGKPILAEFRIDTEPQMTPREMVELVSSLSSSGYEMDVADISRVMGFDIRKKSSEGGMSFNAKKPRDEVTPDVVMTDPIISSNDSVEVVDNPTASTDGEKTRSVAPVEADGVIARNETPDAQGADIDAVTPTEKHIGEKIVESLQTDFKEVANELTRILALPENERSQGAAELLNKLDSLIPDDPEMAEVIEEQIREAFIKQLANEPTGNEPMQSKAIPNSN